MNYSVDHKKNVTTFSPPSPIASILMVPFATSADLIKTVLELKENQHHAWGVKELLKSSIQVSVIQRYSEKWERFGQDWIMPRSDNYQLIYSNHNRMLRSSVEHIFNINKTPIVSLIYAGEYLFAPKAHDGILCMTPHAHNRFKTKYPKKSYYTPWGIDPESLLHTRLNRTQDHFISTGVTKRDFETISKAASICDETLYIAARGLPLDLPQANIKVISENIDPWEIRNLYQGAIAGLVILHRDDKKRLAVGWTNILEMMAVGLPIIKTRTGSLDDIVDLDKIGAGILVEPENPRALANAMFRLRNDKVLCKQMGENAANYVRENLTMEQFARPLIDLIKRI